MPADPCSGDRMYRRLQVPPEATAQQIRRAYRKLAHDVHPDAHPEDPDASRRFHEITEAYEVLSSPERRARYDRARREPTAFQARLSQSETQAAVPIRLRRSAGWNATTQAVVLGGDALPLGSAPLIAGPVRIGRPAEARSDLSSATAVELTRLMEAIWPWLGMR